MSNKNATCGHERDVLRWALGWHATHSVSPNDIEWPDWARTERALQATADPAKLAEMMAEERRRLGLVDVSDSEFAAQGELRVRVFGDEIMMLRRLEGHHKMGGPLCSLSQARAILLVWLDLPDGDTEGALRALEGEP